MFRPEGHVGTRMSMTLEGISTRAEILQTAIYSYNLTKLYREFLDKIFGSIPFYRQGYVGD